MQIPYGKELETIITLLQKVIVRLDILLGICITGIIIAIAVILFNKGK